MRVTLDKETWEQALAHYRAWNEAEFLDQVRNAGRKTAAEKWREYQALFVFSRRWKPTVGPQSQAQSFREWAAYYEQIQRFEARRRSSG